jgi:hypothetical protein
MADKLRQQVAVIPTFVDGEKALSAKLNTLGAQLRRASQTFEKAIGDMYGENFPYSANNTGQLTMAQRQRDVNAPISGAVEPALDLTTLARSIGPMTKMNPRMVAGSQAITEVIPTGVHSFMLTFKPDDLDAVVPTTTGADMTGARTVLATDITGNGWSVDDRGRVYSAAITTGGTIEYTTDPSLYAGGMNPQGASFSVIPDINQVANDSGVVITGPDGSGRYIVTLPTVSRVQSNHQGSSVTTSAVDPVDGVQLVLPVTLTDLYTAGEALPGGIIYLKNYTTGEIYLNAVYAYDNTTTVYVSNINIDDEIAASNVFYLVCIGTDLTTAVSDLQRKLYHNHDGTFGEPPIRAADIAGWTREPGVSGVFTESAMAGNYAPQYLHRDGYQDTGEASLNDGNIMRGNLVIGKSAGTPGTYAGTGTTFKLAFGNLTQAYIQHLTSTLTFRAAAFNFITGDTNFSEKVAISNGLRLNSAGQSDVGEALSDPTAQPVDSLRTYLRFPHFQDNKTSASLVTGGYMTEKYVHASSCNFILSSGDPTWWGSAGMFEFTELPNFQVSGPGTGNTALVHGILDLNALFNGLGTMDTDGAAFIWSIEVDVSSSGSDSVDGTMSVFVALDTVTQGSPVTIEKTDDGFVTVLSFADGFQVVKDQSALIVCIFTAGETVESPILKGFRIRTQHKYLSVV